MDGKCVSLRSRTTGGGGKCDVKNEMKNGKNSGLETALILPRKRHLMKNYLSSIAGLQELPSTRLNTVSQPCL